VRTRRQRPAGCVPTKGRLATIGGVALGATLALGGSADAATFTVSNLEDTGSGSLRDALAQANATAEADTVNFASGLSGTIHLASSLQATPYPVAIQGPGASQITISGGGAVRDLILGCLCPQAPSFSVSGLTFTDGKATDGAGIISLLANLTISNSVITGNVAAEPGSGNAYGAGVYSVNSSGYSRNLTIDHSTIANNSISSAGGATNGAGLAATFTKLTVNASTISGNTAAPSPTNENFGGGVIVQNGSADISGSTIANNRAYSGGGMRIESSAASSTIVNSTIVGNDAPYGGGIRWPNGNAPHTLTITGSTIAGNGKPGASAGFGGGIDTTDSQHVVLRDSIISGNTAHQGSDLYSAIPSYIPGSGFDAAFSLLGSTADAAVTDTVAGSNIVGQDPQLGPLATNGGPVQTMALPASSPAVDKGSAFALTSDGRGVLRPIDFPDIPNSTAVGADGSDIGAFELQPSNALTLGKLKKNKKKGTAMQTVNLPVPDAGTVTLSGKGLKPQTKSAKATGVLKLKVIAKGKAKKNLRRKGKAKLKEKVTYNPTGQTPKTLTKKLKLVKRPKRR
jgi:hypothetical protein